MISDGTCTIFAVVPAARARMWWIRSQVSHSSEVM
jgi:hypothetical protein